MDRARRGRHKVFLGMAAGVGKTYSMLQEGQAEAEAGRDVVLGWLEPHDRADTIALAEHLEVVPRRRVRYREAFLFEMDLTAVVERAPELALIDELAHTNAPGVEHAKRWEDVEDVLHAGIDVFSTVNVQHLQSLNDEVADLTGGTGRETLPDDVLRRADSGAGEPGGSIPSTECRRRSTGSSRSRTSPRCASWRCARWPRRSSPSAWS